LYQKYLFQGEKMMRFLFSLILLLLLSGCGPKKDNTVEIRVGTVAGSDTQLMEVVQNVALEKYGLHIEIIQYTDYSQPNEALMKGDIDVNVFQHQPYLIAWNAAHHGDLIAVAKSFVYPMGIYSYKVDRIRELNKNSVIAIPNDATNEARALLLMQKAGLITLRFGADVLATPADIVWNPLQLQIQTADAAQLPGMLNMVDAAVINNNYAILAGLIPGRGEMTPGRKDAIYLEDKDTLYANVFVIRPSEKNNPHVQQFINAFYSPQVWLAAQTIFHGGAIKAW
jgi:D-methionine transport system substrate-binding protein